MNYWSFGNSFTSSLDLHMDVFKIKCRIESHGSVDVIVVVWLEYVFQTKA